MDENKDEESEETEEDIEDTLESRDVRDMLEADDEEMEQYGSSDTGQDETDSSTDESDVRPEDGELEPVDEEDEPESFEPGGSDEDDLEPVDEETEPESFESGGSDDLVEDDSDDLLDEEDPFNQEEGFAEEAQMEGEVDLMEEDVSGGEDELQVGQEAEMADFDEDGDVSDGFGMQDQEVESGDGSLVGSSSAGDAETISDFFERGEGSGMGELGEIEGFFEAEDELSEEFASDKLDTLLSAAKQGVADFEGLEGYVEHERYWVNKPYAYVSILYNDAENDYLYYVVEPQLDEFEEVLREDLEERLRDVLMYEDIDSNLDREQTLEVKTKKIIDDYGLDVDRDSFYKILYYLKRDYIHNDKIDPIMRDPNIEDISCDGNNIPIFVYHRDYRDLMTNVEFDKEELQSFVIKLAQRSGKHISVADPLVDASMPDGSRVQMTLGSEITSRGSTFTIRKFKDVPFTPIDLVNWNTFSLEQMAYLWMCIENNKSLIFAGGTASGKTTSMNAVSLFIPPKSKVVSIEDTREITLPHMNWIPSVTRDSFTDDGSGEVDMYELLRAALRQRPEYLVVGEVRGEEALTLFQAMSTGHTTYSTMHADSVDSAIHRLENPPISVPRSMLKALDIVSIQTQTFVGGKRVRRNEKLVEILGIDPKTRNIRTDDIFQWEAETDSFIRTGNSTALQEIKRSRGWSDEELERQIDMRREVLEYLLENDITDYEEVSKTIQSFIVDPERILESIRNDELDFEELEELKQVNL